MSEKILIGVPCSGTVCWGTATAAFLASLRHETVAQPSCESGPNFNALLCVGMNAARKHGFTRLVMVHADVTVVEEFLDRRYADVLVEEMDEFDADFISVPNTIKDVRLLTSCGIGDPNNPWNPWRRFTTKELKVLPPTFNAAKIGYGDKYLLHNNAVAMWNLQSPIWWKTDADGVLKHTFNFTERLRLVDGEVVRDVASEDWAYSRQLWELGARTIITSKIEVIHHGSMNYSNRDDCGTFQKGDDNTRANWGADAPDWNQLTLSGAT